MCYRSNSVYTRPGSAYIFAFIYKAHRRRHENEHLKRFSLTHSLLCYLLFALAVRCALPAMICKQIKQKSTRQAMTITSRASTRKKSPCVKVRGWNSTSRAGDMRTV